MAVGFQKKEDNYEMVSQLLELAASGDLMGFRRAVEEEGCDVDGVSLWYGARIGSKKMGLLERTPLMIAAMFGSVDVMSYILEKGGVDVNRICGSDGATALHCAIVGGATSASRVIKLLLDASADVSLVGDYAKNLDALVAPTPLANSLKDDFDSVLVADPFGQELNGLEDDEQQKMTMSLTEMSKETTERREYPIDTSLPDIKNGIYGTDEFRMYTFKIKPCSRAYSHDWTECPFVHPGENARRRDPRKYHYSCVPCPEFRKGTCRQGEACEYAHGIFECWLHPAQYRTRLCKDEAGCNRRVCFFAHKPEELRPLYAFSGSAIPSPRSFAASGSLDMSSLSPLVLGSPSVLVPSPSTPPMTPTGLSSPKNGSIWHNQGNSFSSNSFSASSRLKTTVSARDMELDVANLHRIETQHLRQQQFVEEMYGVSSPSSWNQPLENNSPFAASPAARVGEFNRLMGRQSGNLEDIFASVDNPMISQLHGLSLDVNQSQLQSPNGILSRQNMNHQLRSSYPTNLSSSPGRSPSFGLDSSLSSSAAAFLTSRSTAFAKRSQSFVERSATNQNSGFLSPASPAAPSPLHGWGSPTGKLDWGVHDEELHKLRKSASFRSHGNGSLLDESEMPWASPHGRDASPLGGGLDEENQQYHLNNRGSVQIPTWAEQMHLDQEKTVAHPHLI